MDILQADKILTQFLDAHNDLFQRAADAGLGPVQRLTLSADQRAFVNQLLRRFSREPITTREDRRTSDLGVILAAANVIVLGPDVVGGDFTDEDLNEAARDMIFTALMGFLECRQLIIKNLKPKTQEVLAWTSAAMVTAKAGGFADGPGTTSA